MRFGIDLFSIRSQGWTPFQYLDYCAKWKATVVHFSEIRFIGNLEPEHLKKVRQHAERLGVEVELGMRSVCPTSKAFDPAQGTAEQQITRMIDAARAGKTVVRLKGGDPFVFGRGGEEAQALVRAGVPFEIVPGLSSALAGPALCGIPVTHRGTSAAVLILSGHDLAAARALLGGLPPEGATLVVLMGRERRGALAELLLQRGWSTATPAAVVQGASLPEQALWRGTLGTPIAPRSSMADTRSR